MARWIAAGVAALLVVGLVVAWSARSPLPGVAREPAPRVHDLVFTEHPPDAEPRQVGLVAASDGLLLVYFGYLSCPDVCPLTMIDIARARRELPAGDAARVQVALVTVDPSRDDPERLRGYLAHFFDDPQRAMTGTDAQLAAASERLGLRFEVEQHEPGAADYDVSHSAIIHVVDDRGVLVRELPFGSSSDDLARVLRHLLP